MDMRYVITPKQVTSPIWVPPPLCTNVKQTLTLQFNILHGCTKIMACPIIYPYYMYFS